MARFNGYEKMEIYLLFCCSKSISLYVSGTSHGSGLRILPFSSLLKIRFKILEITRVLFGTSLCNGQNGNLDHCVDPLESAMFVESIGELYSSL